MNLVTLRALESIAERKFEKLADEWVYAIAKRENVGFNDLRPYLVSLYYDPEHRLDVVFVVPKHTPIKILSIYSSYTPRVAKLENGKLIGNYDWSAFKTHSTGSASFHGVDDLGHALLLAHWAYEEDERAKWA